MNKDESQKIIDNIIVEGQSTAEKLNCVICINLPYKPQYLDCCEQLICLNCIERCMKGKKECPFCKSNSPTYKNPNKFIMRTFDEVIMKCRYAEKGCEEKMNYSNILEHEKKCEKNPFKIAYIKPSEGIPNKMDSVSNNIVNSNSLISSVNDFSLNLHHHSLRKTNLRKYNGYDCNFCNKTFENTDPSYCCELCSFDCCIDCYNYAENGRKRKGVHNHDLYLTLTDEEIECDLCELDLARISNWSCDRCKFNICLHCYWKR